MAEAAVLTVDDAEVAAEAARNIHIEEGEEDTWFQDSHTYEAA